MMAGAQNYQTTVDGITYTNYSGYDAGVMYSSNLTGDVVIPKTVKFQLDQTRIYTWTVRKIYSGAFSGCTAQSIFIPSTITSIQSGAFGYYELASIVLEDGNTVYDSRDNCNAIIETATNILVAGCKNTVIPNSVTKIGKRAFSGCIGLTSITIPNSVTTMEDYAFAGCSDLTSVKVESATPITISSESFYNCPNAILYVPVGSKDDYETATGWKDFKEIVEYAAPADGIQFADANVKALCVANWDTNGDGELSEDEAAAVTDLGNVFNGNHEITSFNELQYFWGLQCNDQDLSGNTYSGIPYFAFSGCTNLKQVTLPNVEAIGHAAFSGSGLTAITIPSSVRMIGDEAFYNTNISEFVLPASVTDLCDGYDVAGIISSPNLKSIVVESGNSVYDSRDNCNAIVRTASNQLINGCSTTTIPGTVTSIRQYAFMGCQGLTAITIPISVTSIGGYAFEGCNNLTSVTVENPLPFTIGNGAFSNCANATLHVPAGSKAAYKDADGWKDFKEIVEPVVPGSAEDPFTCAEAIAFVSGLTADTPTETEYYVKGKVCKMQYNYSYQYGSATFWISDDGTDNGSFYVYRTLYFDKERYNGGRVPNIGDEVVLCGQMVNYKGTTPETYVNQCRLVLLNDKTVGTGLEVGDLFVAKTPEDVEMFFVVDKTGMSLGKTTVTGCSVGYAVANRPETYTNAPACINSNYEGPITIPETVEGLPVQAVAPSAFAGAKLTSVVIPSTVWDIETNAFKDCQNLASVKMPENVILNTGTFKNCTSLTSVELPKGVQLWAMDIIFSGCTNLTAITVNDETPYELQGNYFVDDPSKVTLYVPAGSKAAYEAADYWKDFKEIIEGTPEGNWTNLVANSDMEGTDVSCFFSKEAGKDVDPVSSTIVDDAGKDGSRGIVVNSSDDPEYSWDSQFFVRLPKSLPAGTIYRVSFNYKASRNAEVSTQMHTEPGGYIHWEGVGSINFTTEWQSYEHVGTISVDQSPEDNMQTIAFNLSESSAATTYYFDNFVFEIDENHIMQVSAVKTHPVAKILSYTGEPQELITAGAAEKGKMLYRVNWGGFSEAIPTATEAGSYTIDYKASGGEGYIDSKIYTITVVILPAQMTDLIINGDMEGDDVTCFFSRENFSEDETVVHSTIVDDAGKDDSRGIVVHSVDNPAEEWTSQFFVRLPKPLPAGTAYKVRFDYKASQEAEVATEAHSEPSAFIYWEGIGTLNFTTDWQTYEHVGTISAEQSPEDNMQTIVFRLSKPQTATTYYFDNFVFEIDSNSPVVDNGEQPGMLCINELMQSNIDCLMDDLNDFPDSWVELYNSGTTPVNLGRYKLGLTNDAASAWQLPAMIIGAGQYVVVYCDKVGEKLHTDFRLDSGKGGSVYLFFDGSVDDKRTNIAKQPAPNISLGYKSETDKTWGYQYEPTPGAANCNMLCTTLLGNPVFSEKGRVLTTGTTLQLELTSTGLPEGTVVRYTLDGSEPTASSTTYTSPITINKTTTVRAKAFCEGYLSAPSVTQSYIFLDRDMTLPVISLVTDDRYWYDDQIGIIANNTSDKKVDWRRPVNIEFFDAPNTLSKINQLGETRVQGGATRSNPLKSLAIYANKRFGTKRFAYEFFPDQRPGISEFKSLLLRNAGNDYNDLYMRDAVIQRTMAQHADLDWQGWRPAIVFKNGVYKGMLNIRERSNEDNICSHYQDAKGDELEDIDMIENWWDLKEGDWNNFDSFKAFYNETGHTMQEYEQWMDCGEFANLMLMNLYYSNRDFPGNNIVMWRPRTADGKWRWIAKDTDFGLGLYGHPADYNTIAWINDHNYDPGTNWANGGEHTVLFRHLMDDASFRKMFLDRAAVYMGDFLNERGTRAIWDPMVEMIKDEYPYHEQAGNGGRDWNSYNDELQGARQWVADRTEHFYQQLANFYKWGTPTSMTVNKDLTATELADMTVSMNGIKLSQPLFDGMFFAGRQVTLKAEGGQRPVKGWRIIYLNDNNTQTVRTVAGAEYSFTMPTCKLLTINALFEASEINDSWTNLVVNGDMEGDDVSCFYKLENLAVEDIVVSANISEGVGKDGSRGIVVNSVDNPAEDWNTEFYVRLPKPLPAGIIYHVKFDYKASQEAEVGTVIELEPSKYIHWQGIGSLNFTTEWQTYEHVGIVSPEQSPEYNMQTIAFQLAKLKSAASYYFDNIVFEIDANQPISFADANVKALCVSNWDTDNDGELSITEAAAVSDLGEVFKGNTEITSFNELQYFTGLSAIADNAFQGCSSLASVTFPKGLETIGVSAFRYSGLTSVKMPSSLTKICKFAFRDCNQLANIDFNECPAKIYEEAFAGCNSLTEVTVPATCTMTEWNHFAYCEALTSATILTKSVWLDGMLRDNPKLETVVLTSSSLLGNYTFGNTLNMKTVTFLEGESEREYEYVMGTTDQTNCLFIIPEGTAESFLRDGYINISDKSALPNVKAEYEAEVARIQTMANGIADGDKATLATAISTANEVVNAAENYPAIFKQIAAVKDAAKAFLATATLPANTDVTAAMVTNPDFNRYQYGWSDPTYVFWWLQGSGVYTNGDVTIEHFMERSFDEGTVEYACKYQTIKDLPAGKYRLECDAIASWWENVSAEVTGVSLFAGSQETTLATEFRKPQHFTVEFEQSELADVKIGVKIQNGKLNWVAFDNVRLVYLGADGYSLYAEDLQTLLGATTLLEINLDNKGEVSQCQFDLRLPAGITVATKSNDKLDVTLTERASAHSVSSNQLANGDYRFVVISKQGSGLFTGNDGTLLEIKLDIPKEMEIGDYTVKVLNSELSVPKDNTLKVVNLADRESELIVKAYTPGDVNNDGSVSVTDVGCAINYILEKVPEIFVFDAADMNGDKKVTVTDVGLIIDFILNGGVSSAPRRADCESLSPRLALQQTAEGYALTLDDKEAFIGFQFDVELADGATINGVQLKNGKDHLMTYRKLDNGMYRVVCYSLSNSSFTDNGATLLNISTTGDMTISDVRLTTTAFEELNPMLSGGTPTGIASLNQGLKMSVRGRTLQIVADRDATVRLYTLSGSVYRVINVHRGVNTIEGLKAGVYMIENRKMIIR